LGSGETTKQQENSSKFAPKEANIFQNGDPNRYKIVEKLRLGRGCDFAAFWERFGGHPPKKFVAFWSPLASIFGQYPKKAVQKGIQKSMPKK
jgi:hypothetical protein